MPRTDGLIGGSLGDVGNTSPSNTTDCHCDTVAPNRVDSWNFRAA
jgi:hypothetical protein